MRISKKYIRLALIALLFVIMIPLSVGSVSALADEVSDSAEGWQPGSFDELIASGKEEAKKMDTLLRRMNKKDRQTLTDELHYAEKYEVMPEQWEAILNEIQEICADAETDEEKVKVLFHSYRTRKPETLSDASYAEYLDLALKVLNIPSMIINGIEFYNESFGGGSYVTRYHEHDWNAVYVNGRWGFYDVDKSLYNRTSDQMAKDHLIRVINDGEAFQVKGVVYEFIDGYVTDELLIIGLPDNLGKKYTVPYDLAGYKVKGFDADMITDCEAWERVEVLKFKPGRDGLEDFFCADMPVLKKVVLTDGMKTIGTGAFAECVELEKVILPSDLEVIGDDAFVNCISLVKLTLPDTVLKIGDYAFSASGLNSMAIPASVTELGTGAFYGCKSLKTLTLSDALNNVPVRVAKNCTSLTSVKLPEGATAIGKEAFYNCSNLVEVTIPDKVVDLNVYSFANCYDLEKIVLGEAVSEIAANAFQSCEKIRDFVGVSATPPKVATYFYLPYGATIHAPEGYLDLYNKAFSRSYYVKKYKIKIQEIQN